MGIKPEDALKTLKGAFKGSGMCKKHGRVMLHSDKCKECRRETKKPLTQKEQKK